MKKVVACCGLLALLTVAPAFAYNGVDVAAVRRQAESGNPESQSQLGVLYASGVGIAQDKTEAVRWYGKSAEQGFPLGQWNLAFMYLRGEGGVKEDPAKARELFQQAADKGFAPAQYDLAMMYIFGIAGEPDREQAEKWLRRSAGQKYRAAEKKLAELLGH